MTQTQNDATTGRTPFIFSMSAVSLWAVGGICGATGEIGYAVALGLVVVAGVLFRHGRPDGLPAWGTRGHVRLVFLLFAGAAAVETVRSLVQGAPILLQFPISASVVALMGLYLSRPVPSGSVLFTGPLAVLHTLALGVLPAGPPVLPWLAGTLFLFVVALHEAERARSRPPVPSMLYYRVPGGPSAGSPDSTDAGPERTDGISPRRVLTSIPGFVQTFVLLSVTTLALFVVMPRPGWNETRSDAESDPAAGRVTMKTTDGPAGSDPSRPRAGMPGPRMNIRDFVSLKTARRTVMRVRVRDRRIHPRDRAESVYLRGRTYTRYANGTWWSTGTSRRLRDSSDGRQDGWIVLPDGRRIGNEGGRLQEVTIHVEDPSLRIGFVPYRSMILSAQDTREIRWSPDRLLRFPGSDPPDVYRFRRRLPGDMDRMTDPAGNGEGPSTAALRSDLDRSMQLRSLANQIATPADTRRERAEEIASYLSGPDFSYTLNIDDKETGDPLVHFVLDRQSGYCVHFAGAMVLMLRSLRIPSRVVSGFVADEWDEQRSLFQVRALHAHAWVEVKTGDDRWTVFDPTPEASVFDPFENQADDRTDAGNDPEPRPEETVMERERPGADGWGTFIRDYGRGTSPAFGHLKNVVNNLSNRYLLLAAAGGVFFVVLLAGLYGLRRTGIGLSLFRTASTDRASRDVRLLQTLRTILRNHGVSWNTSQTPRQNARRLSDEPYAEVVTDVVDAYYRTRFGGECLSETRFRSLIERIRSIEKKSG